MTTPIRFSTDTVTTRDTGGGQPVGSQEAREAIQRVKQRMRPKRGRTPLGISLVDARTGNKEVTQ